MSVDEAVRAVVAHEIEAKVGDEIATQLEAQLGDAVENELESRLESQVESLVESFMENASVLTSDAFDPDDWELAREGWVVQLVEEKVGEIDTDEVQGSMRRWLQDEMNALPNIGGLCSFGQAFKHAVLTMVSDALGETVEHGADDDVDRMRSALNGYAQRHGIRSAAAPESVPTAPPVAYDQDAPEANGQVPSGTRTWFLRLNHEQADNDRSQQKVIGPFTSEGDLLRWAERTNRHGTIVIGERP